jgi:hypothetical protein
MIDANEAFVLSQSLLSDEAQKELITSISATIRQNAERGAFGCSIDCTLYSQKQLIFIYDFLLSKGFLIDTIGPNTVIKWTTQETIDHYKTQTKFTRTEG